MADQRRTRGGSPRPGGTPRPGQRPAPTRRPRTPSSATSQRQQQSDDGSGRQSRFTGRAAVLFLVLLVLLISYASSLRAWLQQRDDTAEARAEVAAATQGIESLEEQKERLNDPSYIESQARERFGWLMPGETGYTVLDENGDVLGSGGGLADPAGDGDMDEQDWYAKMWGSVQAAGAEPPAEPEEEDVPADGPKKGDVVRPESMRR